MNPEAAAAIPELAREGVLPREVEPRLLRIARGELVSVRAELRALLYAGVLLITAGAGVLVNANLDRLGPLTIAVGLAAGSLLCLVWVAAHAEPFTWGEARSTHLALDYLLLLGVLLAAADLAYVEARFTPLGDAWPWHFLVVAILAGALAFRYDSRVVLSLALTAFATWRGVSMSELGRGLGPDPGLRVRASQLLCGALFVTLGFVLRRAERKAHFEPVATYMGWLLLLGAAGSGAIEETHGLRWSVALLALGGGLALLAYRGRRFGLLAVGIAAGYVGVSGVVFHVAHPAVLQGAIWFVLSGSAVLVLLLVTRHRLGETA